MNSAMHDISDPAFPHLATVFDPDRMASVLEQELARAGNGPEIHGAKIVDVNYDPGQRCNLLFQFKVSRRGGGKTKRQMVTARLLKTGEHAPEEPGLEEIRRFRRAHTSLLPGPYFCVAKPRMILCTFPFDAAMPWLAEGLDTTRLKGRFSRLWAPDGWKAVKVKVTLLGYTPQMRGSMLYQVKRVNRETGARDKIELIGKTNAFKKTGKLFADSWALWETSGKRFPMPRPVGYLGAPRLTLQERVDGLRLGSMVEAPNFADRVIETAEALALLHRLRFPVNARRRARDEVKSLTRWGDVVGRIRSDLRSRVTPFLERLRSGIEARTKALCAIHADFHHTNILVDGDRIHVIDFDEMAYGDPAVDVGRFLASLRIPTLRTFGNIHALDEVREQFLEAYVRQTAEDVSRIRLFEAASLVTSAASAFRIQRPNWDEEVSLLLDEAEAIHAQALRSRAVAGAGDRLPALSWKERIRWASDPAYVQAMLDRPIFDASGVDVDGCELIRREETRSGFRARYRLVGSLGAKRWRAGIRVVVSKRNGGHTSHRLLEQHYPLLERHPQALHPPRPLTYLHRLSASVTESCRGDGLHTLRDTAEIRDAMGRVGEALAAWHEATARSAGPPRDPGRPSSRRISADPRVAEIIAKAGALLVESDRTSVLLLHDLRLHEIVMDSGQVGLVGVNSVLRGDPRHDLAALMAAWTLQDMASSGAGSSPDAIRDFLDAYQNARGERVDGLAPFEALALAERAHQLRKNATQADRLLALAGELLEEPGERRR